jgi:GrpB-like predicted nucleotidyltransferase (UPF0157 family)
MNDDDITLVPYDLAWPARFLEEAGRLRSAIGDVLLALEHIGSTAIPGLSAKPVLDLLGCLRSVPPDPETILSLSNLGYASLGENGLPGRHFFRKGQPRSHHLHLVPVGSPLWDRHLAFREHLRSRPADALAYERLKRDLSLRFRSDRERYTAGKSDFIEAILARAVAETPVVSPAHHPAGETRFPKANDPSVILEKGSAASFVYRAYASGDADGCLAVFRSNTPDFFLAAGEEEFARFLDLPPGPFRVLVTEGGAIVACGGIAPKGSDLILCWGMVDRRLHRSGLGSALLRARLLLAFETYGPRSVRLSTSQRSAAFFARHGFAAEGEILPDHFGPGLDRHDLRLDLTKNRADELRRTLADTPWIAQ